MRSVFILGVRIDDVTHDDVRALFLRWLAEDGQRVVVTPNPEFVLLAQRDAEFCGILNRADLALPDGVGLRFAVSALTDMHLQHRVTGSDTLLRLAELCASSRQRLLLFGGAGGSADAAAATLREALPSLDCVACDPGTVDAEGNLAPEVARKVRDVNPAVLVVALGQGKQERCIVRNIGAWPSVRIAIGVGGACDTVAGRKPRAPHWLQRSGLEWVWRLVIEPRRWRRIFSAFPVFSAVVVWATLRERRFLKACRRTIPEIIDQLTR